MERIVILVNGFQPLTIITKRSILDVAAVLDPPLIFIASDHAPFHQESFLQEEITAKLILLKQDA